MKKVIIHTDGGCHGNPGPGAWAACLDCGGKTRFISGGEPATTNNRMELTAAIESLRALRESCDVTLHTDSSYLKNGITEWLASWKRNGWRTKTRAPVKNADLWRALDEAATPHKIQWLWVKGHAGNTGNEQCDTRVQEEIARIKQEYTAAELKEFLAQFAQAEGQTGAADDELPIFSTPSPAPPDSPADQPPSVQGMLF